MNLWGHAQVSDCGHLQGRRTDDSDPEPDRCSVRPGKGACSQVYLPPGTHNRFPFPTRRSHLLVGGFRLFQVRPSPSQGNASLRETCTQTPSVPAAVASAPRRPRSWQVLSFFQPRGSPPFPTSPTAWAQRAPSLTCRSLVLIVRTTSLPLNTVGS